MATIRRAGFGTVFEVENEKVGIGTTGTATNTLQVLGRTKASDAKVIGLSTLTTYQGFVDKEAKFGNALIDVESQAGTFGEVIIEGDVTVSSASTLTSSVNQLTLTDSFSVPTGNTDSRIHCKTAGSMRFNEDLGTLEFYTGDEWRTVNSFKDTGNRGRMLVMGGGLYPSTTSAIQSIQINIQNSAITFGELTRSNRITSAAANEIRGLCMGGSDPETDVIDYVTMASEGNAVDFGNLTSSKFGGGGASSSTRGVFCGGFDSPANTNDIDYFEIMTLGNALDFGDLTRARRYGSSVASPTRVVTTGGTGDSYPSTRVGSRMTDIFTISSKGNATDFAPLTDDAQQMCAFANATRGIFPLTGDSNLNTGMDQLNIVSGGNATHHGDLGRRTSAQPAAGCNQVRGLVASGFDSPATSATNHIDMIEIQTSGNAVDFGDLARKTTLAHGCSDSHGGLGGF